MAPSTTSSAALVDVPIYPLYSTTYNIYHLSPLYHGPSPLLEEKTLRTHSRRLRDMLKGDNVRGVQVDYAGAGNAIQNAGPLEDCRWTLLGDEDVWIVAHGQADEPDPSQAARHPVTAENARGIHVELQYAEHSYHALLLRDPGTTSSPPMFTALPLMLAKMPGPIRDIFFNYLSTSFDTRVAPLKLPSSFLTSTLESYFRHLTADGSNQSIEEIIYQLHVQLTFPTSTTLLKHIDITIARNDVPRFVEQGAKLQNASDRTPFTSALSEYLKKHLAINLSNPKIQISRITCGAFILASEGRIKLVPPTPLSSEGDVSTGSAGSHSEYSPAEKATQELYSAIIKEAAGAGRFLPDIFVDELDSSTPTSTEGQTRKRRKRGTSTVEAGAKRSKGKEKIAAEQRGSPPTDIVETPGTPGATGVPTEPPPPYELHDPSLSTISGA